MSKKKQPNILLIVTDQQNIDTITAYREYFPDQASGPHHVRTPNLDKLVRGGRSFLLSHSANPVSCPARASLFTGHYATGHGVTYNNIGIDKTIPNLGQWLSEHSDYRCFYAGKWHAGGAWNYPALSGNRKIPGFETIPIGEFALGEHNDYQASTAVKNFLEDESNETPFFLVAGLMNPHDICFWTKGLRGNVLVPDSELLLAEEEYPPLPPNHSYAFTEPKQLAQTRQKGSEIYWKNYAYDYYRMVEKMDLDVGRILQALENRHDDTVLIFTSDHGEGLGRHSRVQKWHPYDQSVKVPLIFYAPGYIDQGIDQKNLVSGVDLFPTVCDIAGVEIPENVDGVSLMPLLRRRGDLKRDYIIAEFMHTGRVVRTHRYKYVKMYRFSGEPDAPFVRKSDGGHEAFRPGCGDAYEDDPVRLLFDMQDDPWECKNLAEDPRSEKIMARMETMLRKWEEKITVGKHYDRN